MRSGSPSASANLPPDLYLFPFGKPNSKRSNQANHDHENVLAVTIRKRAGVTLPIA